MEQSCRFRLSRVHSPEDHVCRYECADLQSHLAVMVISKVRLRNLSGSPPHTCHRARTPLIFAFDAVNFSRRSPAFHSSLTPGSFFFLPRFGLTEFSHSSRSHKILRQRVRPAQEREAKSNTYSASSFRSVSSSCWSNSSLLLL